MQAGPVLLTGFGPFGAVVDNPSAAAARAIDGWRLRGHTVITRVLPVSYARGPSETVALARGCGCALVVGLGVASTRREVEVERYAVRRGDTAADVDGACWDPVAGPARVTASLDVAGLATALRAEVSEDAGRYVCNAWLYEVTLGLDVPVGFVHMPPGGIEVRRLVRGLSALLSG